jgi:predicted nucleotidyltransferase component of viral defense system
MQIIDQMLKKYNISTLEDKKHAIKEIIQEIVLAGLSRANFFSKAAFYGGTALRIFYNLDRFSEDLDFSLLVSDPNFTFDTFIPVLRDEVESLGLKLEIEEKIKTQESSIKSVFLRGNTKEHFLLFYPNMGQDLSLLHSDEKIKVKFEIDINPPSYATTEMKYRLLPSPYQVRLYDLPSLFAGKIDAVLRRNLKTRVKGRDFYDYIYFLAMDVPVNIKHLKARLLQSEFIDSDFILERESLIELLKNRFNNVDFEEAKKDVLPFVKDIKKLDIWSADFFIDITEKISVVE